MPQPAGTGRAHLLPTALFADLSFVYPLKLLSPTPLASSPKGLRTIYVLSYGGGLISGDKVWLNLDVDSGAALLVLTQGTTKVFKRRPGVRLATPTVLSSLSNPSPSESLRLSTTIQTSIATLQPNASLYYLPSPTACFENSRYTQRQRFDLPTCGTANLIVLDWFTCGREKRGALTIGEVWDAERLEFFSEVWWGSTRGVGERIVLHDENRPPPSAPLAQSALPVSSSAPPTSGAADTTLQDPASGLKPPSSSSPSLSTTSNQTSYASSLYPYKIFLTLILTGPATQSLITHLLDLQASETKINHLPRTPSFLWSLSVLEARNVPGMGRTVMVRACAVDGEMLKLWLYNCLKGPTGMGGLIGDEMWERAMG